MKTYRLLIPSLLLVTPLIGCGQSPSLDPNVKETIQTLVAAMQRSKSSYISKGFELSFAQQYKLEFVADNEEAHVEYALEYSSSGSSKRCYEPSLKDALDSSQGRYDSGSGYLSGIQAESVKMNRSYKDKKENSVARVTKADYEFNHSFGIKYDATDLYAKTESTLANKLTKSNSNVNFAGKVAKEHVGGFSNETLDATFRKILYLRSWETLDSFMSSRHTYYQSVDFSSDEAIAKLIKDFSFEVVESNTSLATVSFAIPLKTVMKDMHGKEIATEGKIYGVTKVNKSAKILDSYEYDMKDYLKALIDMTNANRKSYTAKVDDFVIRGKNLNTNLSSLNLTGPFTPYDGNHAKDFTTDFNSSMFPNLEGVEVVE